MYEENRGAYRALVGKGKGRRPLGRPRRRLEDNIKMDLWEVKWGVGGHGRVNFAMEQATKTQRGSKSPVLLFL